MSSDFTVVTNIAAARKTHRCHWCGERILVGQPYIRVSGSFEGDMGHTCWHPECDAAFDSLPDAEQRNYAVDGLDPGMFKRGAAVHQ